MNISCAQPPIVQAPHCWIFLSPNQKSGAHLRHGWCVSIREEAPIYIGNEAQCVVLLPLLELARYQVLDCLETARISCPDYADAIRTFPLAMLLRHVFKTALSGYWPAKAMDWIADDPYLIHLLADELEEMARRKAISQSLRHRAKRMLRSVLAAQ